MWNIGVRVHVNATNNPGKALDVPSQTEYAFRLWFRETSDGIVTVNEVSVSIQSSTTLLMLSAFDLDR